MENLFNDNENVDDSNAILYFEGKKINVKAYGTKGIFSGYLTFIDGEFSVANLQENFNEKMFFATNNVNVEIGELNKNKHLVVLANSFDFSQNCELKNITLIENFCLEKISYLLNDNEQYEKYNYIKCVLFFPDDISYIKNEDLLKCEDILSSMPDKFYNFDFSKSLSTFLPYREKQLKHDIINNFNKFPIFYDRKKIAVIDFGISTQLKEILQSYFEVILVPYTETALHIFYLYNDKKIDGVIFSDFLLNTYFINQSVCNEMKMILNSIMPVLGIGAGGLFIAELFGSTSEVINNNFVINEFNVLNMYKKQFQVSNCYFKKINMLSAQLKTNFIDEKANTVGFECREKNVIGYTFSLLNNDVNTAFFLNKFFKKIKHGAR